MPFLSSQIIEGNFADRPAAESGGRLFFASDVKKTYRDTGTAWVEVSDGGDVRSVAGRTGTVVLAESDITGLVSDLSTLTSGLAAKAPIASPTFTGTPAAPTATTGTNTTQLATTAFVVAQIGASSPVTSVAGRTGAVVLAESDITGLTSDLSAKAPLASPTFTGTPAAPTPTTSDNSTKVATTAFVQANVAAIVSPFLIVFSNPGTLAASLTVYIDIPSNLSTVTFPANFANSVGKCGTNPTSTAVFTIKQNGSTVGTITISTSGTFTFATTGGSAITCAAGDELAIIAPATPDPTLADVRFTAAGSR